MGVQELGKLETVNLREIWETEAQDFTPWLADNLALLGEALEIELTLAQIEAQVGTFSLDILATDETGAYVAIENQLDRTDHTHLGQLLTYAAGYDVRILIWVTPEFRDEHRATLDWLNRWSPEDIRIFGVEVRAVRIGDSLPAPEFVPVVLPNEWTKIVKQNPEGAMRRAFYQALVDQLRESGFTDKQKATSAWIQYFPSGIPGLEYCADIGNNPRVVMTMSDKEVRRQVFDSLRNCKDQMEEIETQLGLDSDPSTELVWKTAPGNISVRRIRSDDNLTDEVRIWMFEYLIKFRKVFNPRVEKIIHDLGPSD